MKRIEPYVGHTALAQALPNVASMGDPPSQPTGALNMLFATLGVRAAAPVRGFGSRYTAIII